MIYNTVIFLLLHNFEFWEGSWLEENLRRVVGDGVDNYFWFDPLDLLWHKDILLKVSMIG
jgi:hypothetical protein